MSSTRRQLPAPGGLRILLVEDHADTVIAMKRLLERAGHHVTTATSIASALAARDELAQAGHSVGLLISDIGLPDGSGLEVMSQLRATRPVPGIAVSGFGAPEDVQCSLDAGYFVHLTKPVNFDVLVRLIEDVAAGKVPS